MNFSPSETRKAPQPFRSARWWAFGAAATVLALVAACSSSGSSDNSDGGQPAGANNLKGDPIVTMTIASVNYNGPTYESGLITAKAFEQYINSHGGINGRPLKALTCDEKGVATGSEACAREAVSEGAISIVGSPTFYGGNVESVAHAAGLSVFGTCCSFTPNEFNDDTSFVYSPDPIASGAAVLVRAYQDGCQNITSMSIDIPTADASNAGALRVAKAAGFTGSVNFVKLPPTSQDYSAQVAEAVKNNPDCILMVVPENQVSALLPAYFQTGNDARLYGSLGNFDAVSVRGFEDQDQVKNATLMSFYSPFQGPAFADFRQALDDYDGDTKGLVYDSLSGLGTWAAFRGFVQIASAIKGDITRQSFIDQANKTVIDNGGETKPIDLGNPLHGGVPPYDQRVLNRTFFFQKLDGTSLGTVDMQPILAKI